MMEYKVIYKIHLENECEDNIFAELLNTIQKIATPKYFGAVYEINTPMSAVVELSQLSAYWSFNKKLQCLINTYDLMYAEIKSYLSEKIAETNEETIPIVNDKDVLPVLMAIIVKAKVFYICSDLIYIRKKFIEDENEEHIVEMFVASLKTLWKYFQETKD